MSTKLAMAGGSGSRARVVIVRIGSRMAAGAQPETDAKKSGAASRPDSIRQFQFPA
jgi:hypothetical protein